LETSDYKDNAPLSKHFSTALFYFLILQVAFVTDEDVRKFVEKGTTQPEPVIGSGKFSWQKKGESF
jgi:hypothetical protein